MTPFLPTILCVMATGGSMLITCYAYALLTRLLKCLSEL
uniref:Uncharacterized protein MANES_17G065200 n=1 Tax=Rhizophora mucronata TaxID=61149 RepID=A0A2P2L171_RHIMU